MFVLLEILKLETITILQVIGAGAIIANSEIGDGYKIGPGVVISRGVIGKYCKIRAGVSLFGKEIPDCSIVEHTKL